jgi:DNA-binding CsgD family transcriptional regulator
MKEFSHVKSMLEETIGRDTMAIKSLKKMNNNLGSLDNLVKAGSFSECLKHISQLKNEPKPLINWRNEDWEEIKLLVEGKNRGVLADLDYIENLTQRDRQICYLTLLGFGPKQLSVIFSITPQSVSNQKLRIKSKISNAESSEALIALLHSFDSLHGGSNKI